MGRDFRQVCPESQQLNCQKTELSNDSRQILDRKVCMAGQDEGIWSLVPTTGFRPTNKLRRALHVSHRIQNCPPILWPTESPTGPNLHLGSTRKPRG